MTLNKQLKHVANMVHSVKRQIAGVRQTDKCSKGRNAPPSFGQVWEVEEVLKTGSAQRCSTVAKPRVSLQQFDMAVPGQCARRLAGKRKALGSSPPI